VDITSLFRYFDRFIFILLFVKKLLIFNRVFFHADSGYVNTRLLLTFLIRTRERKRTRIVAWVLTMPVMTVKTARTANKRREVKNNASPQ